jgi:hypothetical protein
MYLLSSILLPLYGELQINRETSESNLSFFAIDPLVSATAEPAHSTTGRGRVRELSGALEAVGLRKLELNGDSGDGSKPTDRHPRETHGEYQRARRAGSTGCRHSDTPRKARTVRSDGEFGL